MNINRRIVSRVVKFIVLVPIVYALCLAGVNSWHSSYKDPGLIFIRPQIPAESNAYYTLLKATNELYWPDKLENKLNDLSENTNWNDSLAAEVLETNRACLGSFDEAMKQPFLLVPEITNFDQDLAYLGGWKELARLKAIQCNSLHHAKKDEEALGDAFEVLNFGERAEDCGEPIIGYLVGQSIKSIGLDRIRQMARDTTLSEANLIQTIHGLDAFGPKGESLTNALKAEYTIQCHYVDDIAEGDLPDTTNSAFERLAISTGINPLFSPRKTKKEFAQANWFILGSLSKPYAEIDLSKMPQANMNASGFLLLVRGNIVGDILFEMLGPEAEAILRSKSRESVNLTATQLILALKVYDMRHGKLPDSLSELVPEFFTQVPRDDFDGKPFRYMRDKKIIYSVGPCLKDVGGTARKDYSDKDYNLPFKIEF